MLEPHEIKFVRESLGLNHTEFAAKLGVTENAARRWEMASNARRHPRWETMEEIIKLAEASPKIRLDKLKITANGRG